MKRHKRHEKTWRDMKRHEDTWLDMKRHDETWGEFFSNLDEC